MSLLEDVFLQDEANEAENLERVIEGDEFDERRRSDSDENSEKEDEAEEDKRRVDPTKTKTTRVVKNPRFLLNPARLSGPRGIQIIPDHFKDFKFKGKGYEKEDLDLVLKRLEHWAYRLYPKFQFEDCLKKIEMLGKKRPVAVHLHKIRSDQFLSEDTVVQKDSSDEETPNQVQEEDEFDKLLQQQIELAKSTPGPNSAKKPGYERSISPKDKGITSIMMPKATSSPSINNEQRERMLRSRRLAEERRLARLKNAVNTDNTTVFSESTVKESNEHHAEHNVEIIETNVELNEETNIETAEITRSKKHNKSNVIDSSDEETEIDSCMSITVDVHTANKINVEDGVVEIEKPHNIINDNNHIAPEGTVEIENKTEEREHNISNSESGVSGGNSDNNNGTLQFTENLHEKSDENEELRYDDSDMNIDTNEHHKSNQAIENITNSEVSKTEENERDDIAGFDKKALSSIDTSNGENDIDSVPDGSVQEGVVKGNGVTEVVPEELIEDVMDVDFTEDF